MLKHKVNRLIKFPGCNASGGGSSTTSKVEIPAEAKPYLYGNETTTGILPEASNIYNTQKEIGPYQDQQVAPLNPVQDYGYFQQSNVGDQLVNAGMSGVQNLGSVGLNYLNNGADATNSGSNFSSIYNSGGGGSGVTGTATRWIDSGSMPTETKAATAPAPTSKNANYKDNINAILGMEFRNPYLEETIQNAQDSASQAFNRSVMPALRGNAIGAGQYGSSRDAIAQGLAGSDFAKYLTDTTANAYSGAYNQNYNAMTGLTGQLSGQASAEKIAAQNRAAAMAQASASQAAAEANSKRDYDIAMRQLGLSSLNSQSGMGNMGLLGSQSIVGAGNPYQLQNQQIYNTGLANEQAYRGFNQGLLNNYAGTVIPGAGMGQTQTNQNNPGALETVGTLGNLGLMAYMLSDRRLKENIVKVGKTDGGFNLYRYNYLWDKTPQVGVMADEVMETKPEAVINIGGVYAVNYAMID